MYHHQGQFTSSSHSNSRRAAILVAVTGGIGYGTGLVFALLWNRLQSLAANGVRLDFRQRAKMP